MNDQKPAQTGHGLSPIARSVLAKTARSFGVRALLQGPKPVQLETVYGEHADALGVGACSFFFREETNA